MPDKLDIKTNTINGQLRLVPDNYLGFDQETDTIYCFRLRSELEPKDQKFVEAGYKMQVLTPNDFVFENEHRVLRIPLPGEFPEIKTRDALLPPSKRGSRGGIRTSHDYDRDKRHMPKPVVVPNQTDADRLLARIDELTRWKAAVLQSYEEATEELCKVEAELRSIEHS